MSAIALPKSCVSEIGDFLSAARRTLDFAVRPTEIGQEVLAVIIIGVVQDCFLKSLWGGNHESSMP